MTPRAELVLGCALTLCTLPASAYGQRHVPVANEAAEQAPATGQPVRVDGVAALVGGLTPGPEVTAILRSDVELRARLALTGRTSHEVAMGPLPPSLLHATLEALIGEHLIAREAQRVRVTPPTRRQVTQERQRIEQAAGGTARVVTLLAALGATSNEVDAIAQRRALVGAFLQANLEGETVVTDAQVERAYAERQAEFVGRPRGEAMRELRATLARQALDLAVHRWVSMLGKRTPVRIHATYGDT